MALDSSAARECAVNVAMDTDGDVIAPADVIATGINIEQAISAGSVLHYRITP